jgi:hypothetical protein
MEPAPNNPTTKTDPSVGNRTLSWAMEAVAVVFWVYLILKTLVFDFDVYLLEHVAPHWAWLVYLKLPLFAGLLAVIWLFTKNTTMAGWFLYALFYPIILVCRTTWRLFKDRRWLLIITLAHVVMSLVRCAKYRFIAGSFSLLALIAILLSSDRFILALAASLLLVVLVLTYSRRFYSAFKPSVLYQMHSGLVERLVRWNKTILKPQEELVSLTVAKMDNNQLQLWSNSLQMPVITNRFCYFLSSKLKEYQRSNISVATDLVTLFVLIVLTVIVFAAVNFALYKAVPGSYAATEQPTFFLFCYYSMSRLFGQGIGELSPAVLMSRICAVLEMVASVSLLGILMSLCLSVKERQDAEELDRTVALIKRHGVEMEGYIRDTYKLTVVDAIAELERLKAGLVRLIAYLSDNIDLE